MVMVACDVLNFIVCPSPMKEPIHGDNDLPWIVCRDFNEILFACEKSGGLPHEERRMETFWRVLKDCKLMEVSYTRVWFTWELENLPETNIRERLDLGFTNEDWMNLFPGYSILHLPHSISDHCPLLVCTDSGKKISTIKKFRFEAWWTIKESLEGEIKRIWSTVTGSIFINYIKGELIGLGKVDQKENEWVKIGPY